jgi:hypothetical protein
MDSCTILDYYKAYRDLGKRISKQRFVDRLTLRYANVLRNKLLQIDKDLSDRRRSVGNYEF